MDKYPLIRKCLVVGTILIFIGVAVAPSINFQVVKATYDNDLVEVTTQACGIKGFGDATVKLTRQQYQNLKQYLVEFRLRLNQTTTREEAVPIFIEAVVELNKYGLLPKEMNVAQTQRLVLGGYKNAVIDRLTHKHTDTEPLNSHCLITGIVHINESIGLISGIGALLFFFGFDKIGLFLVGFGEIINSISPMVVFTTIFPSEGYIITIGRLGIQKEVITSSEYNHIALFFGIKITGIFSGKTFLLGYAEEVV
jgi:hypothetical protein